MAHQVIQLPSVPDRSGQLQQTLLQIIYAINQAREGQTQDKIRQQQLDRLKRLDEQDAADRERRIKAEDIATQRQSEAEIAKLAPQTSMYEPAAPTEAESAVKVPGEEDLGLPADQASVQLGDQRLAEPLLTELTLPSGQKIPFNVRPSAERSEVEAQAAKTTALMEMLQQLGMKTEVEERIKDKYRVLPAPTVTDTAEGRRAWNPTTGKYDLDVGAVRPPKDTSAADAARAAAAGARSEARADRSYQYQDAKLEKLAKPYTDQASRMDRLVATVDQRTPQADALVAPELLTVMAGGQGSGLRMNEAEIARIIGGRSKLEGMKAALNKWRLDPSQALSITDAQRAQIKALITEVRMRSAKAQDLIDTASQELVDVDDVKEQRRVMARLRADLRRLGEGPEGAGAGAAPAAGGTTAAKPAKIKSITLVQE